MRQSGEKKILFVAPHRPDRCPSQRFRYEQYLDHLEANGFTYEHSFLISEKDDGEFYKPGNYIFKFRFLIRSFLHRLRDVRRAGQYDVIFIQRESFMTGWGFFEKRFYRSGAKVLYDYDDAIWLNDVSEGNKNLAWMKNPKKTAMFIQYAHLVFAGNQYLKDYALQYNDAVEIIPTTIDLNYHKPIAVEKPEGQLCIGWTGTQTTLKHFESALPVLKKIKAKYGDRISFKVIVDVPFEVPELNLVAQRWRKDTEIEDLCEIDIGIMPLPDDEWARGKCGFKGLQYMALQVPTVMSPVGVNTSIIDHGKNGFLANDESEWEQQLEALIESAALREKVGVAARETIRKRYSVEANKDHYVRFLNKLIAS